MKFKALIILLAALTGCSSSTVRCDLRLTPINRTPASGAVPANTPHGDGR